MAEPWYMPIYLHPGIPTEPVRAAYYDNLPGNFSFTPRAVAWGWHADTPSTPCAWPERCARPPPK